MNFIRRSSAGVNARGYREVQINEYSSFEYCSNSISRTKYDLITFLPVFLYEQFRAYTNFFFLLISIIQQFPEAAFLGRFTTLIPLCLILSVSAIKEIIEDISRYNADKKVNSLIVEVFRDSKWLKLKWSDVSVGDIIKVYENENFAADILFIKSDNEKSGICYIDTSNLDGENNLKIRNCVPGIKVDPLNKFKGVLECDPPNEFIYEFKGVLKSNNLKIPVNTSHLLLRGSALKNTRWVMGVAVYTGYDTKIMQNASVTRFKRSSVSVLINYQIIALFGIFLLFTFTQWLLYIRWHNEYYENLWYLQAQKLKITERHAIVIILVYGVIYSIIIPISLPVMQEMSRIIQAVFISWDIDLYCEERDQRAVVKTSALNDDLGLVKYIFADKTGTLTENILEFKKCFIDGNVYDLTSLNRFREGLVQPSDTMNHFFIAIVTSPGVLPVEKKGEMSYFTSSPDQKAMILAAKDFGITLVSRTTSRILMEVHGTRQVYEVLSEFEFTSERKRSSVIVRTPRQEIILYVLGADDVILELSANKQFTGIVQKQVIAFSREGLRSICIGMVMLNKTDLQSWYPINTRAQQALYNKEVLRTRAEAMVLKNVTLLGCTAVEDKLQDGVPQTINSLLQAGINIWILTGDNRETAINIGYSCQLLSPQLHLITFSSTDLKKLRSSIRWFKKKLKQSFGHPGTKYALVVSGSSLKTLLDSAEDVTDLILLMLSCKAVICCRTTPKQKAEVVRNVQKVTKYVTLAVGDGANDVAMIQTAAIGIGISGLEGMQAANAADYSIGQFKYLKKLLLVHGTWSYNRIAKMVLLIYYKNVLLALLQLVYTSQNGWSGQLYFDRWGRMLYNVLLTSMPTLALGTLEQNLPASVLMDTPEVYAHNTWFNFTTFCQCMFNVLVHAAVLCIVPINFFWTDVFWSSGMSSSSYLIAGNTIYTGLIVIVGLKSLLHSCFWTNLAIASVIASIFVWLLVLWALSHTWPLFAVGEDQPRAFEMILSTPVFYLYIILSVAVVFIYDIVLIVCISTFKKPTNAINNLRIKYVKR